MSLTQAPASRLIVTTAVTVGVFTCVASFLTATEAPPSSLLALTHGSADLAEEASPMAAVTGERAAESVSFHREVDGFYLQPAGRQLEMSFSVAVDSRMRFQEDEGSTSFTMSLGGELDVLVVAETDTEIVLQMDMVDLEASFTTTEGPVGAAAASPFIEAIQATSWARMDRFGRILGYRFDPDSDAQVRNLQRTLWSGMTAEFTDLDADAWSAFRQDASGPFELAYTRGERGADGLSGTLSYEKVSQETESEDGQMEIVASEGTASVDGHERWLSHVTYEETLRLEVPSAETTVLVATRLAFELEAVTNQVLSVVPFDWDLSWSNASGARDADASKPFAPSASHDLAKEGVDAITQRIEELIQAGEFSSYAIVEAEHALRLLMLADPENVTKLEGLIKAGVLSEEAESVLLAAAGMAATPEAQGLLATTFDDAQAPENRRRSAAWSMLQVEAPTEQVVHTVMASLDNEQLSSGMKSTSLLTAGAVSSRVTGEARDTLLERLLAEEERARSEGRLRTWLNALGNAGFPETLPHIAPYFVHPDKQLRATACAAVRKLQLDEATELLLRALQHDLEERVRNAAAETVISRNRDDVNLVLRQRLQVEESEQVLGTIIDALGKRDPFDRDTELLVRNFANTTSVANLRNRALAILQAQL